MKFPGCVKFFSSRVFNSGVKKAGVESKCLNLGISIGFLERKQKQKTELYPSGFASE